MSHLHVVMLVNTNGAKKQIGFAVAITRQLGRKRRKEIMKDLSLEISLTSLKNWYQEHDTPKNNQKEKEKEEEILKGPCGLWGWIPFVRKLRKTH